MSASVLKSSVKREGQCAIRSSKGMPILDETYYFIVVATNKDEEYTSVLTATGLPLVGVTVSPSGFGVCRTKTATRRTANPYYWDVTCEFSSDVAESSDGGSGGQDPTADPVTWVPIRETKYERLSELVAQDVNGDAVANSAGQLFPTGLTITRVIPVWEFYQFEDAVTDEQILERNETINLNSFKDRDPETLLLTVMSSVVGFYYGRRRRLTQYSLKWNERKWRHWRADTGTYYLDSGVRKKFTTDDTAGAQTINGPLDGAGGKNAVGVKPYMLSFDIYRKISFSFLRI